MPAKGARLIPIAKKSAVLIAAIAGSLLPLFLIFIANSLKRKFPLEKHKGHIIDELLEALYKANEDGHSLVKLSDLNLEDIPGDDDIESLTKEKLISISDGKINLLDDGYSRAQLLVRRHRLAERLFNDILGLNDDGLNLTSCSFEHIVEPSVTETICIILGHPPTCPHGKRIPPGECCKDGRKNATPIVVPLSELDDKANAKVAFITSAFRQRLDRLVNLGLIPGAEVSLYQKKPSYLLRIGATEIAIDKEIASGIFVRKI